jgi:hypothetical protein
MIGMIQGMCWRNPRGDQTNIGGALEIAKLGMWK